MATTTAGTAWTRLLVLPPALAPTSTRWLPECVCTCSLLGVVGSAHAPPSPCTLCTMQEHLVQLLLFLQALPLDKTEPLFLGKNASSGCCFVQKGMWHCALSA